MKRRILFLFLVFEIVTGVMSQNSIDLTFTALDSTTIIQFDSIWVMNQTQECDTVLYWPDTVLSIYYVGIFENSELKSNFQIFQNYPNPVVEQTTVSINIPERDWVEIVVSDMLGRIMLISEVELGHGLHHFRFTPGKSNIYYISAIWKDKASSIKIVSMSSFSDDVATLNYSGSDDFRVVTKSRATIQKFTFSPGDELLFIGFYDTLQSGLLAMPEESESFVFQFAFNIPCPGTPTIDYQGQTYNTVQIMSQCWMKENLNVGEMINGMYEMTDNAIIEKYCYKNALDSCSKYGGLYQWNEMMDYKMQQGTQGICPPGWHLPTDEEWKVLEGAVDSQHGIGDIIWDSWDGRGHDAGTNLKTTTGWDENGNGTNLYGFSAMPGGFRSYVGSFALIESYGYWWTSTDAINIYSWARYLNSNFQEVFRFSGRKDSGYSVRCIRDY